MTTDLGDRIEKIIDKNLKWLIPLADSAESAGFLEQSAIFFSGIGHFLLLCYVHKIRGIAHFSSARCLFSS